MKIVERLKCFQKKYKELEVPWWRSLLFFVFAFMFVGGVVKIGERGIVMIVVLFSILFVVVLCDCPLKLGIDIVAENLAGYELPIWTFMMIFMSDLLLFPIGFIVWKEWPTFKPAFKELLK